MHLPKKFVRGFSLIELLVVISIIGILVTAGTVAWTNAQQKSRDSKRKSDVKAIQNTLELYFQDNGTYPNNDASGLIQCPGPVNVNWGEAFTCGSITYMDPLPNDPIDSTVGTIVHQYYYDATNEVSPNVFLGYEIYAGLENPNDSEACTSSCTPDPLPCNPQNQRNYCQKNQ